MKHYISQRSGWAVFFLTIITFGLYVLYWLYESVEELRAFNKEIPHQGVVFLLFIPLVNIVVAIILYLVISKTINKLTGFSKNGLFLLFLFLPSIAIIVAQLEMNQIGKKKKKKKYKAEKSFKVFGIVQTVLASLTLLSNTIIFIIMFFSEMIEPWWFLFLSIIYILFMITALVTGIGLIIQKPWAPKTQFILGIVGIVYVIFASVLFGIYDSLFVGFFSNVSVLIYSIVVLVIFNKKI